MRTMAEASALVVRRRHASDAGEKRKREEQLWYRVKAAPFTIIPTTFPESVYRQALSVALEINQLMAWFASHPDTLRRLLASAARSDDFTARLLSILDAVADEPRNMALAVLRTDYMIHERADGGLLAQQVEVNTISASFFSLSDCVRAVHRYAFASLRPDVAAPPPLRADNVAGIAAAMARAHDAYLREHGDRGVPRERVRLLMVGQPDEANVYDQTLLQLKLLQSHSLTMLRRTHGEMAGGGARLHDDGSKRLLVDGHHCSVVYLRAGYTPRDYAGDDAERNWAVRLLLERSRAIKCPSVAMQLAGAKIVQQVFSSPSFELTAVSDELRACFAEQLPLGADAQPPEQETIERVLAEPHQWVLKPQREGGGNNLYDDEMVKALREMSAEQRAAYIVMRRIQPPENFFAPLRDDATAADLFVPATSELGVYTTMLYNEADGKLESSEHTGELLRSKASDVNEVGVAAGYGFICAPFLV